MKRKWILVALALLVATPALAVELPVIGGTAIGFTDRGYYQGETWTLAWFGFGIPIDSTIQLFVVNQFAGTDGDLVRPKYGVQITGAFKSHYIPRTWGLFGLGWMNNIKWQDGKPNQVPGITFEVGLAHEFAHRFNVIAYAKASERGNAFSVTYNLGVGIDRIFTLGL